MHKIQALQALVAVVRFESFTGAAHALNTSTQLVSKHIAQLESSLGVRLLNRTTRRVSPTELGRQFAIRAEQILSDLSELDSLADAAKTSVSGSIKLSAPVSFATGHLGQAINQFLRQYPKVNLDISLNDRKVNVIQEGFDLALRIGHLSDSSLVAKRLTTIHFHICASPAYFKSHPKPSGVEQLPQHRYLRYSLLEDHSVEVHKALSQSTVGVIDCNNGDVLTQLAIDGHGIAVQPDFICGDALHAGKLQAVLSDCAPKPMGLYAVYPHRRLLSRPVQTFLSFCGEYFSDPPSWAYRSN